MPAEAGGSTAQDWLTVWASEVVVLLEVQIFRQPSFKTEESEDVSASSRPLVPTTSDGGRETLDRTGVLQKEAELLRFWSQSEAQSGSSHQQSCSREEESVWGFSLERATLNTGWAVLDKNKTKQKKNHHYFL